jgi:hypothetical protein
MDVMNYFGFICYFVMNVMNCFICCFGCGFICCFVGL